MINYEIKRIVRRDGKTEWGVYENHSLLDTFISKQRAELFLSAWKKVMR